MELPLLESRVNRGGISVYKYNSSACATITAHWGPAMWIQTSSVDFYILCSTSDELAFHKSSFLKFFIIFINFFQGKSDMFHKKRAFRLSGMPHKSNDSFIPLQQAYGSPLQHRNGHRRDWKQLPGWASPEKEDETSNETVSVGRSTKRGKLWR